jgi:hypothetical protein
MSDPRHPGTVLIKKLPGKQGKKSVKMELYRAELWTERVLLSSKSRPKVRVFDPEPRCVYNSRSLKGFYRLKVNGKWLRLEGYDYSFVTEILAYEIFRKIF